MKKNYLRSNVLAQLLVRLMPVVMPIMLYEGEEGGDPPAGDPPADGMTDDKLDDLAMPEGMEDLSNLVDPGKEDPQDPPSGDPPTGDPPTGDPPSGEEYTMNPVWEHLQGVYGEKFVIPEEAKTGKFGEGVEENNLIDAAIKNAVVINPETDDPFIAEYKAEKVKEGFEVNRWMQERQQNSQIKNMPSEEFLKWHWSNVKNENGERRYSDEDIAKDLSSKSKIEIDNTADGLKGKYEEALKIRNEAISKQTAEQSEKAFTDEINSLTTEFENTIGVFDKKREADGSINIKGVTFGKADIDAFHNSFKDIMLPKDKDDFTTLRMTKSFAKLLQSNETLYNMMLLGALGDNSIKEAISKAKEAAKEKVESKLGLDPTKGVEGQEPKDTPDVVDHSELALPEGSSADETFF